MNITLDELTISPEGIEIEDLLSEWDWLLPDGALPLLLTAMGDVFVIDPAGAVHFLDAGEGTLKHVADSEESFQDLISDQDFVIEHFFPGRVIELLEAGLSLAPGEIFTYSQPLVLGGDDKLDNVETLDISVHLSLLGQIHEQVKDLPEGTVIEGIEFEGEEDDE